MEKKDVSNENLLKIKLQKNSDEEIDEIINRSRQSKPVSKTKLNIELELNDNISYVDTPRNYGISNFHSSNSLQNSINCITFPKSVRFLKNESMSPGFYKLPDLNNKRGASIGYGKKFTFKDLADSPSPNAYVIKSKFEENIERNQGSIIHPKLSYKYPNEDVPGPQRYQNVSPRIWQKRDPITFKFRHGFFYEDTIKSFASADAHVYNLKDKNIGFNNRFENISIGFGKGNKIDPVNKSVVKNPGPGDYTLPSIFDKNRRFIIPLN